LFIGFNAVEEYFCPLLNDEYIILLASITEKTLLLSPTPPA